MKEELKKEILLALEKIKDTSAKSCSIYDYETFSSKSVTLQDGRITIKIEVTDHKQ
jgi:hypothetical protein